MSWVDVQQIMRDQGHQLNHALTSSLLTYKYPASFRPRSCMACAVSIRIWPVTRHETKFPAVCGRTEAYQKWVGEEHWTRTGGGAPPHIRRKRLTRQATAQDAHVLKPMGGVRATSYATAVLSTAIKGRPCILLEEEAQPAYHTAHNE